MTIGRKKVAIAVAKMAGEKDGKYAVEELYAEQGIAGIRQCQQSGAIDWDEIAINYGAAELSLKSNQLSEAVRAAYYNAYRDAANRAANRLLCEAVEGT